MNNEWDTDDEYSDTESESIIDQDDWDSETSDDDDDEDDEGEYLYSEVSSSDEAYSEEVSVTYNFEDHFLGNEEDSLDQEDDDGIHWALHHEEFINSVIQLRTNFEIARINEENHLNNWLRLAVDVFDATLFRVVLERYGFAWFK